MLVSDYVNYTKGYQNSTFKIIRMSNDFFTNPVVYILLIARYVKHHMKWKSLAILYVCFATTT